MLLNHLKIAFRQLKKQKFYSAINIFGLAVGVTCCLLITLYIHDELSYDAQHPNVENLYRIIRDVSTPDGEAMVTVTAPMLAKSITEEIPEITMAGRLNPYFLHGGSNLVRKASVKANQFEDRFCYADPEILEMFHLPLINGSKKNALTKPYSIIISERIAQKYFPNQNPLGEVLILDDQNDQQYTITAVMENMSTQMHFQYDFLMSMNTISDSYENQSWFSNNYYTYVTLASGTDPTSLKDKVWKFILKNLAPSFKNEAHFDIAALPAMGHHYTMEFQPVTDIYLKSGERFPQLQSTGDILYVWLFAVIALFILIIALVNFVNLSTSRSANRAKEVGLRKVLGSFQQQLVSQFLTESVLMSLLAFLLGTFFASLILEPFNVFLEKSLNIPFANSIFLLFFLGSALVIGLLAGLYPAFYLSGFQPVKVLKGKLSLGAKNSWLRSGLVVVQFAISIGLIIGTLIVKNQMNFIQNKKLGFEKDQVLLIEDTNILQDQIAAFKEALKTLPEVQHASITGFVPLEGGHRNSTSFYPKGKEELGPHVQLQSWSVDEDYIQTLSMSLLQGRNFIREMAMDSASVILNETAVKTFNLGDNPVGKSINTDFDRGVDYTVIGVLEDFHFASLRGPVESLGLFFGDNTSVVSVKTTAAEMNTLIAKTETLWNSFSPTNPFRYEFLDERFAQMYTTEDRVGTLFGIFSLLAIFIACLGLLALTTFMTEQKMKEIGIRKILGASVSNIVFSLSKRFLVYVLVGLFIAVPIAWMQMNNWLGNFAYHVDLEWWVFALAGILAIGIAFVTVGAQSLRAALVNPVESIRGE